MCLAHRLLKCVLGVLHITILDFYCYYLLCGVFRHHHMKWGNLKRSCCSRSRRVHSWLGTMVITPYLKRHLVWLLYFIPVGSGRVRSSNYQSRYDLCAPRLIMIWLTDQNWGMTCFKPLAVTFWHWFDLGQFV